MLHILHRRIIQLNRTLSRQVHHHAWRNSHRCTAHCLPKPKTLWAESFSTKDHRDSPNPVDATSITDKLPGLANIPGAQASGEKLAMVYTCTVCNTRAVKSISKHAYHHGVVLVRCPGCQNLHLIADRMGWFEEESWDVEKLMQERGDRVKVFTSDDESILELTEKDILGSTTDDTS